MTPLKPKPDQAGNRSGFDRTSLMNSSKTAYHNPMASARPNEDTVRAYAETIMVPDNVHEVRVVETRRGPLRLWSKTYSAFCDNVEDVVRIASSPTGSDAAGVYITINPLKAYTLNWNHNTLDRSVVSAADDDVEALRFLYLDIDPKRPRYTCATEKEREAAKARGNEIAAFLMEQGFPMPAWAGTSGSGAMALWRVELEIDEAPLIERCLAALAGMFSDDTVAIDSSVGNPARIARIAGTVNAKSPTPQPDRPWHHAEGRRYETSIVPREALEAIAAMAPKLQDQPRRPDGPYDGPSYDVRKMLDQAGIEYTEKQRDYATVYDLASCLTSDAHDTGASLIQFASGAVAYRCLHDSCAGKGWQDVKAALGVREVGRMQVRSKAFQPIKIGANGRVAS